MDAAWPHWGSFWFGVICAFGGSTMVVGLTLGLCRTLREWRAAREQRRVATALTTPVEALLRSLPRTA